MSTSTAIIAEASHAYPPRNGNSLRLSAATQPRERQSTPRAIQPSLAEEDIASETRSDALDVTSSEEAPDSSAGALKFLVASFVVACVIWSFPNAYGIFLDYYLTRTPLGQKPNARFLLSLSGTCQSGVTYCSSPLVNYLQRRYPKYFEAELWVGVVLVSSSLSLTSLANEPYQIVLLQGLMYAVGATILYSSFISLMPEWFVRRRGLASGVIFAGTSIGGVFLPYLLTTLLNKYGGQTTLRGLGIAVFVVLTAAVPFLRRRVPYTSPKSFSYKRPADSEEGSSWWKSSILWLFGIATTSQAMGFFVTMLYLPSFASSLGLTDIKGTTALAILNAAGTFSRLLAGFLADYISPYTVAAISLSGSGLSVFLLWGLASTTFGALVAFSVVFGLLSTGFTSLATGVIKDLAGEDASQSVMLFGVITFTRGLGNVLAAPISSALLNKADAGTSPTSDEASQAGAQQHPGTVYETAFSSVVIFSGVSMLAAGALSLLANVMNSRRKKRQ